MNENGRRYSCNVANFSLYTVAVRTEDKITQTENLNSNKMLSRAAQSIQDKKVDQQNIKHKERWNNAL